MKNFILITIFLFSSIAFGQATKLGQYDELTTNDSTLSEITVLKNIDVDTTGGVYLPSGTTAERPTPSKDGLLRYNNQTDQAEIYANGAWQPVGGGISNWVTAKSYLIDDVVIENQKIYQCITNHTSGTFATDLASGYWEEVSGVAYESTGLISGGILSIDTDTTKFDLSSHELGFTGDFLPVSCPALNAQAVTNIASADTTYILVDDTCAVTQQTTFPTPQEQRLKAFIGRINHPNRTTIQSAFNSPNLITKTNAQLYDFFDSIGPFNKSGNIISPNGANLSINRSSGVVFRRGINYSADSENPHEKTFTSATVANLFRSTQNAIGTTLFTTLDVANYDNAGTVTAVGGGSNSSTNQRVYLLASGNLAVQYGQIVYSSLANAVAAISNESFTPNQNILSSGVLVGVVSCTRTATAANNDSQCVFSKVSRFDSSGVSAGSNSVATLQSSYNNSITPQITTSTALGSVDIRRGSAADTDNIFRGQNGSGSTTFAITGNGAVTASGAITGSNLSGTNTGDLKTSGENDTTVNTSEIVVPNKQITLVNTNKYRVESGNFNELINPSFEHSTVETGWTVVGSSFGSSNSTIDGKQSIQLNVSVMTGPVDFSQSSTINSAQKSGVQMMCSMWINSTNISDLRLCSLKNGVEDKCTASGGYTQGTGWRQLIVSFLGDSTSNGCKLKSTDNTGEVLVDNAYLGAGSPIVDFTPDMVYSAKVSSTGVVSDENTDFISTCSSGGSGNVTCNYSTALANTLPLNCTAIATSAPGRTPFAYVGNSTASVVQILIRDDLGTATDASFYLVCQKQGADYKTSKAYVASSSDTDWVSCGHTTSDFTGFGTVTGIETQCKREGSDLLMRGKFTSGTATAVEARLNLKLNGVLLTSSNNSTSGIPSIQKAGEWVTSAATPIYGTLLTEPSVGYNTFGFQSGTQSGLTKQNGNVVTSSGSVLTINARIPIQGWTDSGVIVGSFQGYNETPGTSRVETFSVSYGTTNATTICSASPCSYLDQIGNAVTSVTRSGTGAYTLNTSKTFTKLKCAQPSFNIGGTGRGTIITSLQCSNCSSIAFQTHDSNAVNQDSSGTILCQGIPQ